MSFLSAFLYYVVWLSSPDPQFPNEGPRFDPSAKARSCLWSVLMTLGLFCSAHISISWRNPLPCMIYLVLYPIATPDRIPFVPFRGLGCPNYLAHIVAAYTTLFQAVLCAFFTDDVRVTMISEAHRGWWPSGPAAEAIGVLKGEAKKANETVVYFEVVPLVCAMFSLTYLALTQVWAQSPNAVYPSNYPYEPWSENYYHITFSLLRPFYTLLFSLYWFKRFKYAKFVQAMICAYAIVYYAIVSPLATTDQDFLFGSCFYGSCLEKGTFTVDDSNITQEAIAPVPIANCTVVGPPPPSQGSYETSIERTAFNLSLILFLFNGINSSTWINEKMFSTWSFVDVAAFCMFAFFMANVVCLGNLDNANWGGGDWYGNDVAPSKVTWTWYWLHWYPAYGTVILTEVYILLFHTRHLIVLVPVE